MKIHAGWAQQGAVAHPAFLKVSNGIYTFIGKLFGQYDGNNTCLNLQTLIKHPDINLNLSSLSMKFCSAALT
jgi:hypothetical protein